MFLDFIQLGEQGRISSREPRHAAVGLTALTKIAHMKVCLLSKYNGLVFLDKDPDGEDGNTPLLEEDSKKEQKIFDVMWLKSKGWGINMKLFDTTNTEE